MPLFHLLLCRFFFRIFATNDDCRFFFNFRYKWWLCRVFEFSLQIVTLSYCRCNWWLSCFRILATNGDFVVFSNFSYQWWLCRDFESSLQIVTLSYCRCNWWLSCFRILATNGDFVVISNFRYKMWFIGFFRIFATNCDCRVFEFSLQMMTVVFSNFRYKWWLSCFRIFATNGDFVMFFTFRFLSQKRNIQTTWHYSQHKYAIIILNNIYWEISFLC